MDYSSVSKDEHLLQLITGRVKQYDTQHDIPYPEDNLDSKRAAVLLAIKIEHGEVFLLLTKRSKNLRAHPGSVSFPGGKRDESDKSDIETALREAEEEIGLPRSQVTILGILTRGITLPNTVVYPVVGVIPNDFIPVPNPDEVEFAFYIPLKDFLSPDKVTYGVFNIRGRPCLTRSVTYECNEKKANIWGFTANYCTLLAKIVFQETEEFLRVFEDSKDDNSKNLVNDLEEYFKLIRNTYPKPSKL